MSVGLGTLKSVDNDPAKRIEVMSSSYDADTLRLEDCSSKGCWSSLELDHRQMQELSIIIDRFLDK